MRQLKVLAVVLVMSLSLFAAESPFSGTWKLNLAKSKMTPPVPKSDLAVVDADENGLKLNEGDPSSDSVSYQRVNANTLKGKTKKDGKVATDATIVVSKDGKITVNYGLFAGEARKGHSRVRQATNESHCRSISFDSQE